MREHMAVDQYGKTYHALGAHPRKALLEKLGRAKAARMYVDTKDGRPLHVGWIIAGHWLTVYEVKRMEHAA
jgi:hypothetical protein